MVNHFQALKTVIFLRNAAINFFFKYILIAVKRVEKQIQGRLKR